LETGGQEPVAIKSQLLALRAAILNEYENSLVADPQCFAGRN
jgi:hypothetical protein